MSIEKLIEERSNSVIRCDKELENFNCRAKSLGRNCENFNCRAKSLGRNCENFNCRAKSLGRN